MTQELFKPYQEVIKRCIDSSTTPEHFKVCFELIESFEQKFKGVVKYDELNDATTMLYNTYTDKTSTAIIF